MHHFCLKNKIKCRGWAIGCGQNKVDLWTSNMHKTIVVWRMKFTRHKWRLQSCDDFWRHRMMIRNLWYAYTSVWHRITLLDEYHQMSKLLRRQYLVTLYGFSNQRVYSRPCGCDIKLKRFFILYMLDHELVTFLTLDIYIYIPQPPHSQLITFTMHGIQFFLKAREIS